MWKQVKVLLGGKLVSLGSSNYHYKSMIKTLLYRSQNEGVMKQLCSELFYEDTEGAHDSLNDSPYNEGSYCQREKTAKGQTFEMEGLLSEDVLNIDKYVINGVNLDLKLYPSGSAFVLMSDSPQKEYRIIIEEAILKCYTVDICNAIVSAHHKSLEHGGMAQYFFDQVQLNNSTIAQGQRNFSETIFQGNILDKIVVAFVRAERYNGSYALNPFKFDHYNANMMSILINDVSMPHHPLDMNFKRGQFASALCNVLRGHLNVIINAKSFNSGYGLFIFEVNPSQNRGELAFQQSGNVRLEVQFDDELPEAVQVLVYGEFQSCNQVDQSDTICTYYKVE